jgi:hypothetical protein
MGAAIVLSARAIATFVWYGHSLKSHIALAVVFAVLALLRRCTTAILARLVST